MTIVKIHTAGRQHTGCSKKNRPEFKNWYLFSFQPDVIEKCLVNKRKFSSFFLKKKIDLIDDGWTVLTTKWFIGRRNPTACDFIFFRGGGGDVYASSIPMVEHNNIRVIEDKSSREWGRKVM